MRTVHTLRSPEVRDRPSQIAELARSTWSNAALVIEILERVKGIEPSSSAWKAVALPLSYTRAGNSRRTSDQVVRLSETDLCFSRDGGGGRTRTYEGVSQRIYSPPPLPLGTLPRRRTSHPCGRAFPLAGRGYGERLARCQPRENGSGRSARDGRGHAGFRARSRAPAGTMPHEHPLADWRLDLAPAARECGADSRNFHAPTRPTPAREPSAAQAGPPRKTGWNRKPERRRSPRGGEVRAGDGAVILYGWHTVKAALENPARRIPASVRHRERGAPPGRGWPGAGRRDRTGASGRDRAPART